LHYILSFTVSPFPPPALPGFTSTTARSDFSRLITLADYSSKKKTLLKKKPGDLKG